MYEDDESSPVSDTAMQLITYAVNEAKRLHEAQNNETAPSED